MSGMGNTSEPALSALAAQARELGRQAFHADRPGVPALDPAIPGLLGQLPPEVGSGAARVFRAWIAGWNQANADEPLPAGPDAGWIADNGRVWHRAEPGVYATDDGYTLRKTHPTGRPSVRRWVLAGTAPNGTPVDVAIGDDLGESLEAASNYVAMVQERWR